MKWTLTILSTLQALTVGYGLYLLRAADNAMDKTGIGNVGLWKEYDSEAGVVITLAAVIWLLTVFVSLRFQQLPSVPRKLSILIAPSFFLIGWCTLWFI